VVPSTSTIYRTRSEQTTEQGVLTIVLFSHRHTYPLVSLRLPISRDNDANSARIALNHLKCAQSKCVQDTKTRNWKE
uniref:Uncharacterized protein n=1 Tax=Anopheles atroparvus TaxID=41427 RepID=A0AAG5CV52_ANOAO